MRTLARVISLVLFVALVAASAAHGAAGGMALEMALAGSDRTPMADCAGCPPEEGRASACDQLCTAPPTALLLAEAADPAIRAGARMTALISGLAGRTGPPEPHPPRAVVPS